MYKSTMHKLLLCILQVNVEYGTSQIEWLVVNSNQNLPIWANFLCKLLQRKNIQKASFVAIWVYDADFFLDVNYASLVSKEELEVSTPNLDSTPLFIRAANYKSHV